MDRNRTHTGLIRILLAAGAACFILLLLWLHASRRDDRKSFLVIVVDTLRADHLGCYGYDRETSPRIDALAEKSALFNRFYTVVPTTLASFTSLLTSLHPKDHGAFRNGFKADPNLPLLQEVFRGAGYETAAFISSYCLSKNFGMDRGFDHFDERYTRSTALRDNKLVRSAESVTGDFLRWLDQRSSRKPFFALVHYFDPHWPYDPPQEYMERFGASKKPPPQKKPAFLVAQDHLAASGGKPGAFETNLHNLYCSEIRYVDDQVGRILARLEGEESAEDTVLVLTSDHGETFWDHDDYFNHGLFVYDTTIHIPLIIRCPGLVTAPARHDALLSTMDLGPTLLDLAGLEAPRPFQGASFAGLLTGDPPFSPAPREIFSEATQPYGAEKDAPRPNLNKAKCIRQGPWKYVIYPFVDPDRKELYHVPEDPCEENNLVRDPAHAALVEDLAERLDAWAHRYRRRDAPERLDPETVEKLKEIGY